MKIHEDDVQMLWHDNFHDHALSGLCLYQGRLHRFSRDYGADELTLERPAPLGRLRHVLRWKLFEIMVGRHCSYPEGRSFGTRRPQWFWREIANLYYGRRVFRAPSRAK